MIQFDMQIAAHPSQEKFELYEWLGHQGWQADRDYYMGVWLRDAMYFISMRFDDCNKASIFKLAWGGQ